MRKRNWRQYNKSLVQRGSLNFLVDPKSRKTFISKANKSRGRPLEFSDQFIEMLLMIKIHFRLPYGQKQMKLMPLLRWLHPHSLPLNEMVHPRFEYR